MAETGDSSEVQIVKTSRLAIASLLFAGIIPFAPMGLVLGIVALVRIRKSGGCLGGEGVAKIAILAAGIWMILFAIFLLDTILHGPLVVPGPGF